MDSDHSRRHQIHCTAWQSSRIQRKVRSTLAAEAFSCGYAFDTLEWTRAVLHEIVMPVTPREAMSEQQIKAVTVTDCKSLFDTMTREKVSLTDKRLSLEAAIIRQDLDRVKVKWIKSEQTLVDCLTKIIPGT